MELEVGRRVSSGRRRGDKLGWSWRWGGGDPRWARSEAGATEEAVVAEFGGVRPGGHMHGDRRGAEDYGGRDWWWAPWRRSQRARKLSLGEIAGGSGRSSRGGSEVGRKPVGIDAG